MNWRWSILLTLGLVVACGDNKAALISNNDQNNANNANNTANNTNNSSNNANNTANNTNNTANNTNNTNNSTTNNATNNNTSNNGDEDIYASEPGDDSRDYDGTIPTRPTEPTEAFVYDMVDAFCEKVVLCRNEYPVARQVIFRGLTTKGDCMQDLFNRHPLAGFSASVNDSRSQFFADNAPFCAQALSMATCGEIALGFDSPGALVPSCQEALTGLSGPNAVCYSNADCATGLYCVLGAGETCEGTCTELAIPDEYCGEAGDIKCGVNEYCDTNDFACKTYKNNGETCAESFECNPGSFCHDTTCAPIKFGFQAGQTCNYHSNVCGMGLFCDAPDFANGTCTELRKSGESCETLSDCVYTSRCDGSTCVPRVEAGTCTFFDDCLSGACQGDNMCMSTTAACIPPQL